MSHEVSLRAPNPQVRALVSEWLADARLALPRPVTLEIEVAELDDAPPDPRPSFTQGRVAIRGGRGDEDLDLVWANTWGRATLAHGSSVARVTISPDGLTRTNQLLRSFLLNVCIMLFRRVGLHHAHGATALDPVGRGWMLVGISGSGKSTTTALLGKAGWSIGTDDISFLTAGASPETSDVIAWRERLALHHAVAGSMGLAGGMSLDSRSKLGWFAEELGTRWIARVTPRVLAFPTPTATGGTTARPLAAREALSRLMRCSPWVALDTTLADEHLRLMSRLVTQAKSYEVVVGRGLFDRPGLLSELVE